MPKTSTATAAEQDYLKAIYQLGGSRQEIATSALAQRLDITPASVSGMLRKLDEQGLVTHTRYKGVRLTRSGTRQAVEMIRHHRLLELYLAEVIGMPWDKVHAEADALEHVISEDLEARLDELLGYPTHDPHGHPIPSVELELDESEFPTLLDVEVGKRCTVRRVGDRNAELLRYLDESGVRPGVKVKVVEQIRFGGGVRVSIGTKELVLGADAARSIDVEGDKR
jgi:DtxR family transcriptional regulator, Mn-dependent transcriptional regulator